jgi:hypothetical protein
MATKPNLNVKFDKFSPRGPNEVDPNKRTIENDRTFVYDVSDPNPLEKFASYNVLFTLSALGKADLEDTKFLNGPAHDIIIKSSGISGANDNRTGTGLNADNKRTLYGNLHTDGNKDLANALDNARKTFAKDRDMYFQSVDMTAIPGPNEQRRLTSVTQINMTIVEPAGITLFERLRAAAANNNYLDHIDAPYLLTVEFVGFDANGKATTAKEGEFMKRLIPVKLTNVQLEMNQGGATYALQAIPYNEFALVNRFNFPRSSGSLVPKDKKLNSVLKQLEIILNEQNQEEKTSAGVLLPDKYVISIDKELADQDLDIKFNSIEQAGMGQQLADANSVDSAPVQVLKFNSGQAISMILENIMKLHPNHSNINFNEWKTKVATTLRQTQKKSGTTGVYDRTANEKENPDMYFKYFMIRTQVIPEERFDFNRKKNQKIIKFVISPYKIHAYSLNIPGVSTGQNFKNFVYKTYNYMFTGENIDILDLAIDYKYSYFQTKLKDVDSSNDRSIRVEKSESEKFDEPDIDVEDQSFLHSFEPGLSKSDSPGVTGPTFRKVDQLVDYLSHPQADMVNIKMEILGDPAWLGQSQFIPAQPEAMGNGISQDKDIGFWRGNLESIWNSKLRCFNSDLAEPIIMLKFKMPTDVDTQRGVYEMASNEQAMFTGLYKVVQVDHNMSGGKYTNRLHLTRFPNQGVHISNPITKYVVTGYKDKQSVIATQKEYNAYLESEGGAISEVINIGRKIKDLYTEAKNIFKGRLG